MSFGNCPIHYTRLKGVSHIGDNLVLNEIENNFKSFLDWGLLGIGGFFNIEVSESGAYGGDLSELRLVDEPQYDFGQVWEGRRKDWVWETGIEYDCDQPLQITGVQVNGITYARDDPTYSFHVNYPLGRVIFDDPLVETDEVKVEHSYRWVQVHRANTASWWHELQHNSLRDDNLHFEQTGSGEYSIGSHNRIQLPSIVIEAVPRRSHRLYEMGNGSLVVEQDALFHIIGETSWDRNQLADIVALQESKTIWLYDTDALVSGMAFPLDQRGDLVDMPLMYPDFVEPPFRWKKCYFTNINMSEVITHNSRLHMAVVRLSAELVFGTI